MRKILKVARREYIDTVKTKTFIIGVLFTPVLIGAIIFFTSRMARSTAAPRPPRKIAITDLSNGLSPEIKAAFDAYNASHPERRILPEQLEPGREDFNEFAARQKERVRDGRLDAYVVLDEDVVGGSGKIHIYTGKAKAADIDLVPAVENLLNGVVVDKRCRLSNVSPELLAQLRRRVPTEHLEVGSAANEERVKKQSERITGMMVPFFFMYLMFIGIFGMGQQMLTSVIEEKSSRVIEVLLSALSPFQLMAGKILGLTGIGLTVISLWGIAAFAAVSWQGINIDVSVELVLFFAVYYILGFILFNAILAGVGSICNTIKEAQGLMMPIVLVSVLPMMAWMKLVQDPGGTLARVLSFIPPLTPMVMILRMSATSDISPIEKAASIVLLLASVLAVMWLAARVFRTGILMYGKRPRLQEVLRWLRQS